MQINDDIQIGDVRELTYSRAPRMGKYVTIIEKHPIYSGDWLALSEDGQHDMWFSHDWIRGLIYRLNENYEVCD